MADFDQELQQPARVDYLKLVSVRVEVPSDEDITRFKADFDYKPSASIIVEWEPVSYRLVDQNNEPVTLRDRIRLTKQVDGEGLSEQELAEIREGFFRAIPTNRLYSIPQGKRQAPIPFARWSQERAKGGLKLMVNDGETTHVPVGQVYSPQEGHVFEVETMQDEFPMPTTDARGRFQWSRDEGYDMRMRYPRREANDYVPGDDIPTVVVERDEEQQAATTAGGATATGPGADALRAAVQAIGLIGRQASEFATAGAQVSLIGSNAGTAPVLLASEPNNAAAEGKLIEYLKEKGAVSEENGVLV